MSDDQEPKIVIDSDWKAEAEAEKAKLKKAEDEARAEDGSGEPDEMITASFEELVRLMATQALMYLGAVPDPSSGRAILSPEYAKLHIDLLGVLAEKTKGNLNESEEDLLTKILSELRMQFVEVARAIDKAVAEGKISPVDPTAPGGVGKATT